MSRVTEKQNATAGWIVAQLRNAAPDRNGLINLTGAVGSGKTNILRRVAEQLEVNESGLIPIAITAPSGEVDTPAIALAEIADQLHERGLANGDLDAVRDPHAGWNDKRGVVEAAITRHNSDLVLLCDEPSRWYRFGASLVDDTPDHATREFAEWLTRDIGCRRIVTGGLSGMSSTPLWTGAPRVEDGRAILEEETEWGVLEEHVERLKSLLAEPLPFRSVWEMKLLIALSRFKPAEEVAAIAGSQVSAEVLLRDVLDLAEVNATEICRTLARLSLARTSIDRSTFDAMSLALGEFDRALIADAFFDWVDARPIMHPQVRHEIIMRIRDPRRWETNHVWKLSSSDRIPAHQRLVREYASNGNGCLRNALESLHHDLLGGTTYATSDSRLAFVEQLHEIGRTLSYVHRDHQRAASLFRFALEFDKDNAYSHHYLAFNLDWLAEHTSDVEYHYQEAIRLQSTHPWWWSRWISYLATRGRVRGARQAWREAVDALSISEDGSPDWMFLSLHRWVARWLLHWAQLDFAEEVLRSIPSSLADSDTSIRALQDLLIALRQAERGVSVFPLTIPARDWWRRGPHTDLPESRDGVPQSSWMAARVDGIDEDSQMAFLTAAMKPDESGVEPEYAELQLSAESVASGAVGFGWSDLAEGSFIELGYYGDDPQPCIGLHRVAEWRDPDLLPLVPPADRWYRRAVDAAWHSNQEAE